MLTYTVNVHGRLCSNNGEVLREAVIHSLGITLLLRFIIEPALHQGLLQITLPDYHPPKLSILLIYPVQRHLSAAVRLIMNCFVLAWP